MTVLPMFPKTRLRLKPGKRPHLKSRGGRIAMFLPSGLCRLFIVPFFLCCLAACDRNYPSDDLEAAREAAEELDWTQSARLLQRYLRDEMDDSRRWEAWKLLAQSHERMGEREWLVETLENMLHEYENRPEQLKWILRELGPVYESMRSWDKASDTWLRLLDVADLSDRDAARLYEHMGLYYQRGQKFDMAEDMFVMGLEHADDAAQQALCRYQIAYTYYLQDRREEALAMLDDVLAMPEFANLLGRGAREEEEAGQKGELLGRTLLLKGDILETLEKRKEALVCFEQAKSWYPSPEVAQRREELLRGKGKITPVIQGR